MRYSMTAAVRAGHVSCVATMAVLFWLMNFSSAHAQARIDKRAYPSKVLASEQMRAPRWLRDPVLQAARATNTDPAVLIDLADKDPSEQER